jgi:electron transport complex protein RnfB
VKRAKVALIDEGRCIGCTLCIDACPVDAIVGAAQLMHTVVEPWCIGCARCIAPCPVDCIAMVPAAEALWTADRADAARARFRARAARLEREVAERADRLARRAAVLRDAPTPEAKRAAVDAALARARARRAAFARRSAR